MKSCFAIVFLLQILFGFEQDCSGFRNWKWGLPYTEVKSELVNSNQKLAGFETFDKIGDNLELEGCKTKHITYCFKEGKFRAVYIGVNQADSNTFRNILLDRFGEAEQSETNRYKSLKWTLPKLNILLNFRKEKKLGWTILAISRE
jgi:hypothetical protein